MKLLLASIAIVAPAFLTVLVGTAANWAAVIAAPVVTYGSPRGVTNGASSNATSDTRLVVKGPDYQRSGGATHGVRTAQGVNPEGVYTKRNVSDSRSQPVNESLDVVRFLGKTYLAFRSATRHEPDASAAIIVVSSDDERHWTPETTIRLGVEVRHPSFLELDGELFLYASTFEGGEYTNRPRAVVATRKTNDLWTSVSELDLPGQVVTQVGKEAGMPLMVVTAGAHAPFEFSALSPTARVLTTTDGYEWEPLIGQDESGMAAFATSVAFSREEDGNWLGVVNHSVNGSGTGDTSVCFASGALPARWDCNSTRLQLRNASTFRLGLYTYVLGGLAIDAPHGAKRQSESGAVRAAFSRVRHEVVRLASRQRCGIWRVVPGKRDLVPVAELPARGHECDAKAVSDEATGRVTVYSTSSPLDGSDPALVNARAGKAYIYRHSLQLSDAHEAVAPTESAAVISLDVSSVLAE